MYHQGRPYHHITKFVIKHKGGFIPGPPGNQLGLQTPDWLATRVPRDLGFDIQTDPFYAKSKESAIGSLCLILDLIKHSRWDRDNKGYRQPEADEVEKLILSCHPHIWQRFFHEVCYAASSLSLTNHKLTENR